jgi:hypothetical protein
MESTSTDKGIGLGILFLIFALAGAGGMLGAEASTEVAAGGFAVAVAAGCLAIVAMHAYGA